jgi:cellulose synthase/poly-beta-1,6-N-acetylglucosamine synthase-like glycosyltransferase/peptidoglycan/xylan/chitin deacetylase (PgdA/CDA1 family)
VNARERAARAARLRRRIRRPPAHWALLGFSVVGLLVLLLVQGFTVRTTGQSRTPTGTVNFASVFGRGDTFLRAKAGGGLRAARVRPGRRIALSFDDGPDPRWTPRIAAELRRLHVPATFFVVGSQVVRHPDVVRALHADGFELGNHTFTHVDLSRTPGWERSLQLSLTATAVAGATGIRPRLMRPPYSATALDVNARQAGAYGDATKVGYVCALSDFDGRDWSRPGVAEIVRSLTPRGKTGGVALLHDGGGNRSETVAAIARLVPRLRARGFRFVKVSELAGLAPGAAEAKATRSERLRGDLLIGTLAVARTVVTALSTLLVAIAILAVLRALLLVVLARHHAGVTRGRDPVAGSEEPPVSILVPAYNEAVGIERAVRSLAGSDYGPLEVVVIDDGSTDGTADIVEGLGLERVRVIRQANGGKSRALNRGAAAARHDLLITVDGDTIFEPGTVRALVPAFADPAVGAAAGNAKVGNRSGLLGRWQHIEYVMGFNLDRRLYDVLGCMPTVPGAVGAFRRDALSAVGGFSSDTLAEDTDVTIALGRAGWRVVYVEAARAWTEAPASLSALWRQRYRWSYGTMQSVWKHRAAIWSRGEGSIGRRGLPYLVLFQIVLPLLAPLIDLFAVYGLLFLDPVPVLAYWVGFNVLQLGLGLYAFRLDGERPRPLLVMPLQQFVYRQLMYLVVIESVVSALLGTRLRWQHLERTGDVELPAG